MEPLRLTLFSQPWFERKVAPVSVMVVDGRVTCDYSCTKHQGMPAQGMPCDRSDVTCPGCVASGEHQRNRMGASPGGDLSYSATRLVSYIRWKIRSQ